MNNIEKYTQKKEISYEIMRTFACFFVITIHVFSSYFSLFSKVNYGSWFFADAVMCFSRFSVPLFVMLSGALILSKDISIRKALSKALRFLIILIFWSIAYILISHIYLAKQSLSIKQVIIMFLNSQISSHLWYLYMLIAIYILLPLIRSLIKNINPLLLRYYLIIFLSYSFIIMLPQLLYTLFDINIQFFLMVPLMDWPLGCLLLGYYINNFMQLSKNKFIICVTLFPLIIITTTILTKVESAKRNSPVQTYQNNYLINTILAAVCVFIIIKYLSKYMSLKSICAKLFSFIGSLSLEIYLVHLIVKFYYEKHIQKYFDIFITKLSLKFIFELIFVFILSTIMAFIIKYTMNLINKEIQNYKSKVHFIK